MRWAGRRQSDDADQLRGTESRQARAGGRTGGCAALDGRVPRRCSTRHGSLFAMCWRRGSACCAGARDWDWQLKYHAGRSPPGSESRQQPPSPAPSVRTLAPTTHTSPSPPCHRIPKTIRTTSRAAADVPAAAVCPQRRAASAAAAALPVPLSSTQARCGTGRPPPAAASGRAARYWVSALRTASCPTAGAARRPRRLRVWRSTSGPAGRASSMSAGRLPRAVVGKYNLSRRTTTKTTRLLATAPRPWGRNSSAHLSSAQLRRRCVNARWTARLHSQAASPRPRLAFGWCWTMPSYPIQKACQAPESPCIGRDSPVTSRLSQCVRLWSVQWWVLLGGWTAPTVQLRMPKRTPVSPPCQARGEHRHTMGRG